VQRLRLSSLEPWDLPDDFGALWQDPRLMPHLHLPLQSGSDTVLRRMARRCFQGEFRSLLSRLRGEIAELNVTTDLIVGFPGESEEEFEESLAFSEEMAFGHMHIFGFSPREGTKAARLPGRIPGPVIRERSRRMHQLAARMKRATMERYLGQERSVLWEGSGELTGERRRYTGYTDNYLRVETAVDPQRDLRDVITPALLESLQGTPVDRFLAKTPSAA
jgi:threonylcarbamoyladenosine tRNA methylthiotransferase MtaB